MTDKTLSENVKIPQAKVVDEVGSKGARKSLEPASRDEIPSTTLSEIVEEEWNGGKSDYYGTFSEMSRFAKRVSQRYRDSLRKQVENFDDLKEPISNYDKREPSGCHLSVSGAVEGRREENRMKPLIAHSDLTGRWYVVTRYKVEEPGQIIASQKYDVTEQIKAILSKANLPAIPLFDDEEKADALQSVEKISVEREERSSRGRRKMSNYFCSCAACACQTLVVVEFTICEDCKHENHKFRRKERAYD